MWVLDYKESWAQKNWCFWTVVLEKTLESPLYRKEIQLVNPKRNKSWVSIGRTDNEALIVWPPDAKNWLIGKDPDAGEDWRQEGKGTAEKEMVGWHHWLGGHEFEQHLRVGDGHHARLLIPSPGVRGYMFQFSSVTQLLSPSNSVTHPVYCSTTDFLSITNSRSVLKLTSFKSVCYLLLSPSPPVTELILQRREFCS